MKVCCLLSSIAYPTINSTESADRLLFLAEQAHTRTESHPYIIRCAQPINQARRLCTNSLQDSYATFLRACDT